MRWFGPGFFNALARAARYKPPPPPRPVPPSQVTMYDSVDLGQIPSAAQAVAGYVGGRWPTFTQLASRWPHAHRLSIAVAASQDAECLDIEQGDATPDEAPAWVRRQQARGVKRPVVYASVSQMPKVRGVLAAHGVSRDQVREWTAHYTGKPHRCTSACGFGYTGEADATQYANNALGRTLDASLCSPYFF